MLGLLTATFTMMVLRVCAGVTQGSSIADDYDSAMTNVISNPATRVPSPTRVLHSTTSGGHQFIGRDGHLSEFHGTHLRHLSPRHLTVFNPNNWLGYHTTLNDYLKTPNPGIHICDKAGFKGNCQYQAVVANPAICQQLPKGPTQTMGSFLIEKDLQCAFHSDKNCQAGHTWGRYTYPMIDELRSGWDNLGGDILAYKCRKCDGCSDQNENDWDGQTTLAVQPAGGDGFKISKDQYGHPTAVWGHY